MTPSTFAGRIFCIFYALVGIPLCMLTLKVMGDKINELLGNFFIIISTKRQLRDRKGTKIKCHVNTDRTSLSLPLSRRNALFIRGLELFRWSVLLLYR